MIRKKILLPVLIGSVFFLGACGGEDTPSSPVINPTPSSVFIPLPTSSSGPVIPPTPTSSIVVPASSAVGPSPVVNYAPLAPSANVSFAVNNYVLWRGFHFVTEEAEMALTASSTAFWICSHCGS